MGFFHILGPKNADLDEETLGSGLTIYDINAAYLKTLSIVHFFMDNAQASCALSMIFVLFTNNLSYIGAAQLWLM